MAEGCRRTRFFHRYLIRLGVFALVSQVPFTLATGTWGGNVILTFFLAAAAICGYERLVKAEYSVTVAALPLLGACVLALVLNTDYGFPAVLGWCSGSTCAARIGSGCCSAWGRGWH